MDLLSYAWSKVEPWEPHKELEHFFIALEKNPYAKFPEDFIQICYWFLFIVAVHLVTRFFVFKPLAYKLLPADTKSEQKSGEKKSQKEKNGGAHTPGNVNQDLRKRQVPTSEPTRDIGTPSPSKKGPSPQAVNKFLTAAWKGSSYATLALFAFYCLYGEDWPLQTRLYWRDWPLNISYWVQQLYFVEFAYYFHASMVIIWEPKMKDTAELLIHHFVTVALLGLSYCWGFYRVGVVILILHDISDPFMESAKLCIYTGYENLANIFFAMFTLSFMVTRWFLFPTYIITTVWTEAKAECQECYGWWTFMSLLSSLQVLHIFWGFLVLKILVTAIVSKGVQGDVREEE